MLEKGLGRLGRVVRDVFGESFAERFRTGLRPFRLGQVALLALMAAAAIAASGCIVGPKYVRPIVQAPPEYKELGGDLPAGTDAWKPAQPSDAAGRGQWWTIFNDPTLNTLEDQLNTGNQSIAAAMSSFMAARALTRQARAQLFPTVTTNPNIVADTPAVLRRDQSILVIDAGIQRLPKLRDSVVDERHRERNLRGVRAAVRCVVGSGSLGAAQ